MRSHSVSPKLYHPRPSYRLLLGGTLLSLALVGAVAGCSGDKEEPEEPAAEPAASDEPAAAPATPPPAAAEATPAPAAAPAAAAAPAPAPEAQGFTGPVVTRYVNTFALKIHPQPSKETAVLGWVKQGDKVNVVLNGEWAKLDNGRYISARFLVENDPGPAKKFKARKAKAK